ncbi:hypothetical protein BDB00DRAFT_816962, partial [Zychaea mexicana]|uniref:uncharacterized protein n=1 Tax=Zychaea mexicana TaxID=64656 RepID=UPI0022FF3D7A
MYYGLFLTLSLCTSLALRVSLRYTCASNYKSSFNSLPSSNFLYTSGSFFYCVALQDYLKRLLKDWERNHRECCGGGSCSDSSTRR